MGRHKQHLRSVEYRFVVMCAVVFALLLQPIYGASMHQVAYAQSPEQQSEPTPQPTIILDEPDVAEFDSASQKLTFHVVDDVALDKVFVDFRKSGDETIIKTLEVNAEGAVAFDYTLNMAQVTEILPLGDYTMQYRAVDMAGETSPVYTYTFKVVDRTKPTASLVSPSVDNQESGAVVLRVDATDERGLDVIVADIYKDDVLVNSASTVVGGATTGMHTATMELPEGVYQIRYSSTDMHGNLSVAQVYTLTIAAKVPVGNGDNQNGEGVGGGQVGGPGQPGAGIKIGSVKESIISEQPILVTKLPAVSSTKPAQMFGTTTGGRDAVEQGTKGQQDERSEETAGVSRSSVLLTDVPQPDTKEGVAQSGRTGWSVVSMVLVGVALAAGFMTLLGIFGAREEYEKSRNGLRIVAVGLAAAATVGVFLLEDFSVSIGVVNWWTILFAAIAAVQVAIVVNLKTSHGQLQ